MPASIFTTTDEKKEEQQSALQIFLKDVTQLTLDKLNIQENWTP